MAGGKIDILVEPDTRGFGTKLETGLSGAIGSAKKIGAAMGVALGAGEIGRQILKIGVDFDSQLNSMSAVTQATGAQMDAVAAKARALGNDTSLASTSASDAAAAMTELAKGGFTVEQSMAAAKGTLQLATAAQVDAATAATIQSQALQAFSLQAEDAARVADILAGAANASSAEMPGIAAGLQQAGTVAHGFGISIEDTTTALAMFANAGITGSDAGTLLKTSLLAITDQGKPAQAAIKELGLELYDMEGKFVGLPSMFDQLARAQSEMSDEAFQAASSTLFGSDAIRQAMVAAQQGGTGFETLRLAVTRQGQAAEMAAAQTQGLPGAIEKVQNAAEEAGLKIYSSFSGPAASGLTVVADGITSLSDVMMKIPFPVWAAGFGLLANSTLGLGSKMNSAASAVHSFSVNTETKLVGALRNARVAQETSARSLTLLAQKHREAGLAAQQQAAATRNAAVFADRAGAQMAHGFAARTAAMGASAKGLAGGGLSLLGSAMGGVGSAATGLMGLMGGPWGLAFMAGSAVVGHLVQKHQEAKAAEEQHKAAQESLKASLDQTTGSITEQTKALQAERLRESGAMDAAREFGIAQSTIIDAAAGNVDAQNRVSEAVARGSKLALEQTKTWKEAGAVWTEHGITADVVTAALNGNSEAIKKVEDAAGQGQIENFRKEMGDTGERAKLLNDQLGTLQDDLKKVQTEQAQDQINAFGRSSDQTAAVLQKLGDKIVAIPDEKTIHFSDINPKVREELRGIGLEVEDLPNGEVKVSFPDGANITQMLDQMGVKITSMPDGRISIEDNSPEVQDRLIKLGLAARDPKTGEVHIKDNISEVINKQLELGQAVKLENGEVHIKDNVQEVIASLNGLGIEVKQVPPGEVLIADNTPEVREKLDRIGVQVTELPDGKVAITDNSPETLANLTSIGVSTTGLPAGHVQVTDTSDENMARLAELGIKTTTLPDGRVVITDNAQETKNRITSILNSESLRTFSEHTINIVRNIRDVFTRANGGIDFFANGAENHVAQIAPGGAMRVWAEPETGGEAYIPLAASKRARSEAILGTVADRFGYQLVPAMAFAEGGLVSGEQLLDFFAGKSVLGYQAKRSLEGAPYEWAGINWGDCSGAQSGGSRLAAGLDPFAGRWATGNGISELTSMGFSIGAGGEGTYTIGLFNGGQGGGHTSGTVWPVGGSPVNVEMGGARGNGQIAGGAASATSPEFTDHAHIQLAAGDGSSFGASSDDLDIESTSVSGFKANGRSVSWGEAQGLYDQALKYLRRSPQVFDVGGVWGSGVLGENRSGKNELVLTNDQWARNSEIARALPEAGRAIDSAAGRFVGAINGFVGGSQNAVVDAGRGFGGQWLAQSQIVQDAEAGLIETRMKAAEGAREVTKREEELAVAQEELAKAQSEGAGLSVSAQRKLEDAERALDKARQPDSKGKVSAEKIADAELKLARAREDADAELEKSGDKNAKAVKKAMDKVAKAQDNLSKAQDETADSALELEAAERAVAASRFQAAADIATSIGSAFQNSFSKIGEYFDEMARLAGIVDQTRQSVSKLRMETVLNDIQRIKALQDLQTKQWDVDRARARGTMSVVEAEHNLKLTRENAALLGATSIEAMSGAMDRFRVTGIFSIGEIASSVIENSADVRAAQWAVEIAKAEAALAEKIAVHEQMVAQYQLLEATLVQNAAVEMLRLQTAQLTKQTAELYGMTANQATGAARGFGGVGKVAGGIGKIIGGVLTGLAGYAVGGPLGALAGVGMAVGGLGEAIKGGIDIRDNKDEMKEAWDQMDGGSKAAIILGALGGAAVSVGGAAMGGAEGAKLGNEVSGQIIDATIGSVQYSIASKIDKINRDSEDQQKALQMQIDAERQKLEAERLKHEIGWASEKDSLEAAVEYAKLQQLLAKAESPEQAAAIAEAARVEAARSEHMMTVADSQLSELSTQSGHLEQLVELTRRAAAAKGTGITKLEYTLPPGESFTRPQVEAMMQSVTAALEQRVRELETAQQMTGDALYSATLT